MEGLVNINFLKYIENMSLTINILRVGQKAEKLQMCTVVCQIPGHLY
jgi:hypothetical protein